MTVYRITSHRYLDIILEGPSNVDLWELEEEWASTHYGVVTYFAQWLVDNKGFKRQVTKDYSFNRG